MGADLRPLWAMVDLDTIVDNYRQLCSLARPSRVSAVVKADAYGHGAVEVSKALFSAGCRDFSVALVDEAIELRKAGIDGEILVLSEPHLSALDAAADYGISVTLYTPEALKVVSSSTFGEKGTRLAIQLKVDTGMFRVGVTLEDLNEIADAMNDGELEGLWSHFAVADDLESESVEFTLLQIERFHTAMRILSSKGIWPKQVHIANTAGLLNYPSARFTKVRVGLGIYGYSPGKSTSSSTIELHPALELISEVSFVKEVAAHERPSYGRCLALERDSMVATIPIGYADGFSRALFYGHGEVLIDGVRYPLAGMVTMDQIMVDLGPNSHVVPGDKVVLIGSSGNDRISANEWASRCSTIAWEVLCGISKRVPRKYRWDRT